MNKKDQEVNLSYLDHKSVKWIYIIFLILTLLTLLSSVVLLIVEPESEKLYLHIFLAVVAIILFHLPLFLKKKFKLYIPSFFQIVALIFIYAHFILGEIFRVYDHSMVFDKILHTTSGIAITFLGVSVINFLNEEKNTVLKLSPFFVAFFSFCFSLMIAVLWEIYEFFSDAVFGTNMQRWMLTSEEIEAYGSAVGRFGLLDTMGDLIVCTIGSLFAAIVCYVLLKSKNAAINRIVFRRFVDYDEAVKEAKEAGDTKLVESLQKAKQKQKKAIKQDK